MDEKIKIAVRNTMKLLKEYMLVLEKQKDFFAVVVRNAIKALEKLLK